MRSNPGSGKLQKLSQQVVSGLPGGRGKEGNAQPSQRPGGASAGLLEQTEQGVVSVRETLWDLSNAVLNGSGEISFVRGQRASSVITKNPSESLSPLWPLPTGVTAG